MSDYLIERVKFAKTGISSNLREELINSGETVVRPLIKLLPSIHSYLVTADILEILGHIGGEDSYRALTTLLEDANVGNLPKRLISQSCIKGLGYNGSEQSISAIINALAFSDSELRYTAIDALSKLAHSKPEYRTQIIKALQLAHQAEVFEKPGRLLEKSLEQLGEKVISKTSWANVRKTPIVIKPDINSVNKSAQQDNPVKFPKTAPGQQQVSALASATATNTGFNPNINNQQIQNQNIDQALANKYSFLTDEEQQEILDKLLTCPDENEKLQIINDLGKYGNAQVIDELLTVIKSTDNSKILDASVDAVLSIAPNDIKLRFLVLEHILNKRVIGQQEAKFALANSLRVAQIGLNRGSSNKPIASFLFLGPTGVGKTELAKALAEALYGNELKLIRIDMSEYTDLSDKNKLIGSPPGYAGYDEGGRLTGAVIKNPQSVVLFDEIEKAHEEIFNLFLQLLDDGRLTDSKGELANFKDTIILMTSNTGSRYILEGLNNKLSMEDIKEIVKESLKEKFKPEFLNRLTDYIIFKPLSADELLQVLELKLKPTAKNLLSKYDLTLEVSSGAKNYIIESTQKQEFGFSPRELTRIINEEIIEPLSKKLLDLEIAENYMGKKSIPRGGKIVIDSQEGKLTLDICEPENKENEAKTNE
ncbi:MAG: AAA family ATPase [Cyanobacteriota bacterium]